MSEQWYYGKAGQQHGPVTREVLWQLAATGQLAPTDLVWRDGMPNWTPAQAAGVPFPAAQAYAPPRPAPQPAPRPTPAPAPGGYGLASETPTARPPLDHYEEAAEEELERRRPSRRKSRGASNVTSILVGGGILLGLVAVVVVLIVALKPGNPRSFTLRAGEERSFDITFQKGVKAEIWVTSEKNTDVDILVFDGTGQMVAMDERIDKDCYVNFIPQQTQSYTVKVRNINVGAALPVGDNYCTLKWLPKE